DTEHDGDILVLARGGDDDAFGAAFEVSPGPGGIRKAAGRFDDDLGAKLAPGNPGRVALGHDRHAPAVDHDGAGLRRHVTGKASVVTVILQQMRLGDGIVEVVD